VPARRFGNVRKLPSGRYQARWAGPDGKERLGPKPFETSEAASGWLATQKTDQLRGVLMDPNKGRVALAVYAREWMDGRTDLRPRTAEEYEGVLARHILPKLGHVELALFDVALVRKWRSQLLRNHVGRPTVAKSYRLLRAMMTTAVEDGRIAKNPCAIKKAGIEESEERKTATLAEVGTLAAAMSERFRIVVLLAAWCQLRRGEILGLRRGDVDLEAGKIRIEQTAQFMGDGSIVFGPPKTAAGRRTVNVPARLLPALSDHLERFTGPGKASLVLTGEKGGPLRPHVLQVAWNDARNQVGVQALHLHDLRHTGATLAATTGATTAELMARLGHSTPRAAMIYQHASANRDEVLADGLSKMMPNPSRHAPGTKSGRRPKSPTQK
jgi:integrase